MKSLSDALEPRSHEIELQFHAVCTSCEHLDSVRGVRVHTYAEAKQRRPENCALGRGAVLTAPPARAIRHREKFRCRYSSVEFSPRASRCRSRRAQFADLFCSAESGDPVPTDVSLP
ncbi:hypothetical protein Zmor_008515 [Zophobas morio]|uniref:Uncharacterized protein n=1 Tax=Zophobas morio TaxID=2755281 RepID=A0AA38J4G0_9CUCU|nr:hypothetical protein Zmor_008515 [Zophobas morio]